MAVPRAQRGELIRVGIDRAAHVRQLFEETLEAGRGFDPRRVEGFVDAMRDTLRAYLAFAGASDLEWAPRLETERRLFPMRG